MFRPKLDGTLMSYVTRLTALVQSIVPRLREHKVADRFLKFDGPIEYTDKIRAPTQSTSKFQAEQALGDWAENTLLCAINHTNGSAYAIHYGDDGKMKAEDDGFSAAYEEGLRRTFLTGKKSDLLLLDRAFKHPPAKHLISEPEWVDIVKRSIGGIEVRSSRLSVEINRAYHLSRHKGKKQPKEPNFTVKVEDLVKVFIWSHVNEKPQAYAQVFFDDIYAISFIGIIEYIERAEKLEVVKHERSDKTTIMVPVSNGIRVGGVSQGPEFTVVHNVTNSGRHDIFPMPHGGKMSVDVELLRSVLQEGT